METSIIKDLSRQFKEHIKRKFTDLSHISFFLSGESPANKQLKTELCKSIYRLRGSLKISCSANSPKINYIVMLGD